MSNSYPWASIVALLLDKIREFPMLSKRQKTTRMINAISYMMSHDTPLIAERMSFPAPAMRSHRREDIANVHFLFAYSNHPNTFFTFWHYLFIEKKRFDGNKSSFPAKNTPKPIKSSTENTRFLHLFISLHTKNGGTHPSPPFTNTIHTLWDF